MKNDVLETLLKTIAAQAKSLRDVGVTKVMIDGVSIELAPRDLPETPARPADKNDTDDDESDTDDEPRKSRGPLHDPNMYARGKVPGRQRIGDDRDR